MNKQEAKELRKDCANELHYSKYKIRELQRLCKFEEIPYYVNNIIYYRERLKNIRILYCEKCNTDSNVFLRIDPYQHEMYGSTEKIYMCGECYDSSLGDI